MDNRTEFKVKYSARNWKTEEKNIIKHKNITRMNMLIL